MMSNSERLIKAAQNERDTANNKAYNWTHGARFELGHMAATLEMAAGLFAIAEAIKDHT